MAPTRPTPPQRSATHPSRPQPRLYLRALPGWSLGFDAWWRVCALGHFGSGPMRASALLAPLVFGSLLASCAAQVNDATSDGFQDADASDDDFMQSAPPHWREMAGRLQRSLDADGLLRARRWGNAANGALLAATGPVALTFSLFGFKLSNVVLSLYVTAFGGMLAGVELGVAPIAPWVASNMGYLTTASGRTALLTFLGGLTWPLGKLGVVPALLTCLNAMFNAHFQALLEFVSEDDGQPMDAAPIVDDERDFDPSEAPAVDHSWEAMARVREAVRAAEKRSEPSRANFCFAISPSINYTLYSSSSICI